MAPRIKSAAQQVADCLRNELARGRWSTTMPGIHALASELGFSRKQVEQALMLLEKEGLLTNQGKGRKRRIAAPDQPAKRPMRIGFLDFDRNTLQDNLVIQILDRLEDTGHTVKITEKTLSELEMDPKLVAKVVEQTDADIWIVPSAPDVVLGWFIEANIPVFAAFGDFANRPIAAVGMSYLSPVLEATSRLIELGHKRIVFLACRGMMRTRATGIWAKTLEFMESHGIATGSYNMPSWEDSREGFNKVLDSLFEHTPPTALVIEEPVFVIAAMQFLCHRGLRVPQDVSIICMQSGFEFDYCRLSVAHMRWKAEPIIRHIIRWVERMAAGQHDIKQFHSKAEFVDGDTLAPPR